MRGGSDSPTPYTVTVDGVQLPDGDTFQAHGHINWRTTLTTGGMHFDPNNNQPGGVYIGESFFPINLQPGECITWVQISNYNEHFGEGGQDPICAPEEETPPPKPEQPQTRVGDEQRTSDPVCVIPLDGTQISYLENRIWSQEWEWNEDIWDWTLGKRVYGDWELADTIITDNNECLPEDSTTPPVIEDGPEDPKPIIPTKDEAVDENQLAMTGSEISHMGIFAGLGLLSLGAAATIIPFVRKRMNA